MELEFGIRIRFENEDWYVERSYLVIAVGGSMARWRHQRFMGENFDLNLLSGTKEKQHR